MTRQFSHAYKRQMLERLSSPAGSRNEAPPDQTVSRRVHTSDNCAPLKNCSGNGIRLST